MNKAVIFTLMSGGIGDYVCLTGFVNSYRKTYPNHKIILIVGKKEYYHNNVQINKLIQVNNKWLRRLITRFAKLGNKLGVSIYNFQFANNGPGLEKNVIEKPHLHYIEHLSAHITVQLNRNEFKNVIKFTPEEIIEYNRKFGFLPAKYIVAHSQGKTSHTSNKEIGYDKIQAIINKVDKKYEWVQIGQYSDPLLDGCIDLRGKTEDLRELMYIISNAKAVMCQEGGYNHIANAFDIPVVLLLTGFNPVPFSKYKHTIPVRIDNQPNCSPCMLLTPCNNDYKCVDSSIIDKAVNVIQSLK